MDFLEKLEKAITRNHSLLCVGLDPDPQLMPQGQSILGFSKAVINVTAELVCAYKPNIAFYEAQGIAGLEALKRIREFIPSDIPLIIDAKRADIGSTARAYAQAIFDYFGADAVTVNPYLGHDGLEPFLAYRSRGVFVLCRTSNPGAADFQSLVVAESGRRLFEVVAAKVNEWNRYGNLGLVMGATYPEELRLIRQQYPEMPLLIPGVGAQGGELELVVKYGVDARRQRTIINSSRQVLYASRGGDFAQAAARAALELRDSINRYLAPSA